MNGWQPIETAPDMRAIIMWADTSDGQTRNWRMASGYINAKANRVVWEGRDVAEWDFRPTHWMPMPPPPVSQERLTTTSHPETADQTSKARGNS